MSDIPREVLVHVLRRYPDPEDAANVIADYGVRRKQAARRMSAIEDIKKKASKDIQKLLDVVICQHEVTKNHGDPSGGSDSYEECLICGEEVRTKAPRFT